MILIDLVCRVWLRFNFDELLIFGFSRHSGYRINALIRGLARIIQRGGGGWGGGVTLGQSEGTHQIVMSFSPPAVRCLIKKAHKRGGGVTGTPGPPLATPLVDDFERNLLCSCILHLNEQFLTLVDASNLVFMLGSP